MTYLLSVVSQKGGVGKTTAALNLAFSFATLGRRVLLVDGDPQGSLALATSLSRRTERGIVDLLSGEVSLEQVLARSKKLPLAVLGNGVREAEHVALFEREVSLRGLRPILQKVEGEFDLIVLDAPSGVGGLVAGLLAASDGALIVVRSRSLALRTLPSMLRLVQQVQRSAPELEVVGILESMSALGRAHEQSIRKDFLSKLPADLLIKTSVPESAVFELASQQGSPVALVEGGAYLGSVFARIAVELAARLFVSPYSEDSHGDDTGLF